MIISALYANHNIINYIYRHHSYEIYLIFAPCGSLCLLIMMLSHSAMNNMFIVYVPYVNNPLCWWKIKLFIGNDHWNPNSLFNLHIWPCVYINALFADIGMFGVMELIRTRILMDLYIFPLTISWIAHLLNSSLNFVLL